MRIHFIGIGGIGVSALAKYYLSQGFEISGSDLTEPVVFNQNEKKKIKFFIGHSENNLPQNTDLVIYTAAAKNNNPELEKAKKIGIPYFSYAEALGELTKKFYTIAISGMHGKSTTTAMIASILIKAGFDPTVILGAKFQEFNNSNFRLGKSNYLVIEADEFNKSFLNYWPKIIVLTNIEEEHLDCYKDLNDIKKTFKEYIKHLRKEGILIANKNDKNIEQIIRGYRNNRAPYIYLYRGATNFKSKINGFNLKIPGKHNLSNAMAALTVARSLKIPDKISLKTLNNFSGIWRRFEYKGKINGAKIFDDYGHHPTEIMATLAGAKSILPKNGRLFLIFQPHQHHRTYALFKQFLKSFNIANKIALLDIYNVFGRENEFIKNQINSLFLVEALRLIKKDAVYLPSFEKAAAYLKYNLKKNDLAIIMGAGDIWKLTEYLLKHKS